MNYLDILQDKEIIAILNQIDELKQDQPRYFGLQHTLNTVEYANQLAHCFNLDKHERELLLVASVLHNIGHLNGKNLHAQTGAEMAKTYLKKHNFDVKDINIIGNAIRSHVGKKNDDFYNSVSACLILADKMDFGATNIKPDFMYLSQEDKICKQISLVEVIRVGNVIQLLVGGKDVDWNSFVQTSIYSKMYSCFETVCKKFGYKFVVRKKEVE